MFHSHGRCKTQDTVTPSTLSSSLRFASVFALSESLALFCCSCLRLVIIGFVLKNVLFLRVSVCWQRILSALIFTDVASAGPLWWKGPIAWSGNLGGQSPPLPTPSFRIVQMSFRGLLACVDFADKSAVSRLLFSLCSLSLSVYFHEFVFKYWFKFFKYNVVKFFPHLSLAPFPLYPSMPSIILQFLDWYLCKV